VNAVTQVRDNLYRFTTSRGRALHASLFLVTGEGIILTDPIRTSGALWLRDELKVNSTCGASNVSFGLPHRAGINGAYLAMAMASGLTSAITNPLAPVVREAVMAGDVLLGNDRDAARWIRMHREVPAEGAPGRRTNRRRAAAPAG
jgi:cobalamin-dependent methionine synthase I